MVLEEETFSRLHGTLKVKEFHPCPLTPEPPLGSTDPDLNTGQRTMVRNPALEPGDLVEIPALPPTSREP